MSIFRRTGGSPPQGKQFSGPIFMSGEPQYEFEPALNRDVGNVHLPSGCILWWWGDVADIPEGFALCDGNNGTPDLRDMFLVGAGNDYQVGDTGGRDAVQLTEAEIPSHNHSGSTGSDTHSHSAQSEGHDHTAGTNSDSHSHGGSTGSDSHDHGSGDTGSADIFLSDSVGSANDAVARGSSSISTTVSHDHSLSGGSDSHSHSVSTDSDSHSHSVTVGTDYHSHSVSSDSHSHSVSIGNTGGNEYHENRPRHYALALIMVV